jgi:PAS domain S-box-containing protein
VDDNAILIADPAGVIRFWSAGAEKAFGHTAGMAIGQTLDLIIPPEFHEAHWLGFRRAMQSGKAEAEGQRGPFPIRHADGGVREVDGTLTLLRQAQGRVIAAMVVFEAPG